MNQLLVERQAVSEEASLAEQLPVIAGDDHDRVLPVATAAELSEQARQLNVDTAQFVTERVVSSVMTMTSG